MKCVRVLSVLCVVLVLIVAAAPAVAQTNAAEHRVVAYSASSGELTNLAPVETVVYSHLVESPGAEWLRLSFRRVELGLDSYLRITALEDGAVQTLHSAHVQQWRNTSAYFNGSGVLVELVAGPSTAANLVEIGEFYAGVVPHAQFTQCGPTDDRVSSNEPEQGRLLNIGCTAWMFSEDSCFASAGHCVASAGLLNTVQFNVPPSEPSGALNHPGPEDQYSVDTSDVPFTNGGVGNDWGLFRVFPNSVTGLMPFEAQGAHLTIATTNPPLGDDINVVGYGVDSGVDNQTQQSSFGPLTTSTSSTLQYQSDTTGGNSGSGVKYPVSGEAVAIHTHGGCSTAGTGANSGTAVTLAAFQAALADFCPADGGGGIPCGDVQSFQSRCVDRPFGNLLQMRVVFSDTSHDGDNVTFDVDGSPQVATIAGRTARFSVGPVASGAHTVELSDPSGCVPVQNPVCP